MTKREKVLVYIAAIIVVVFVSLQFVIMPLYNTYKELDAERTVAVAAKQEMDMKFSTEQLTIDNHKKAVDRYEQASLKFPSVMPNEEIDRILTGMALGNSLNPIMLGMSDQIPNIVATAQATTETEGEVKVDPGFMVVNATMNLNGSYDSLKKLIATLSKHEYIRITKLAFSNLDGITQETAENAAPVSMTYEVVMLCESK